MQWLAIVGRDGGESNGGVDGTRTCSRDAAGVARLELETAHSGHRPSVARDVAGWTGLEPAASGVTGRRSNQLNYHPKSVAVRLRAWRYGETAFTGLPSRSWLARVFRQASEGWWAVQDSNL